MSVAVGGPFSAFHPLALITSGRPLPDLSPTLFSCAYTKEFGAMLHLKHRVPRILRKLTEEQKHMYQSERLINFRWIAKLFATHSSYVLTAADVVQWDLHLELAALGQFAEVAYAIVDPGFGERVSVLRAQHGFTHRRQCLRISTGSRSQISRSRATPI